jgi:hypothetical protein
MKTGLRRHASASARVRYCQLAGVGNLKEITNVRAHDQGKGHASALLKALCADADKDKTVMIVKVQPFAEGLDRDALADWYVRHGFSVLQPEPLVMVR